MNIPAEKWLAAAKVRRSRRKYNGMPLKDADLEHLTGFCRELNSVWPTAGVMISPVAPDDIFRCLIGSYGKIKGAHGSF